MKRRTAAVLTIGVATSALAALIARLPAADAIELVALSSGAGLVVLAIGLVLLRRRHQPVIVAMIPIASVLLGAFVAARAMFVSGHDLSALGAVAAGAGTVGVLGALALADALTESERRVAAMAAHERAIERGRRELVAWVSHDLRTPLAGIRAMVEALDDGVVSEPDEVRQYHERLAEEADRLGRLVDDLFELSRIEANTLSLTLERVSLGDLVSDAVASVAVLADVKGVRVEGRVIDPIPQVPASSRELTRAMRNLLDNAIRHTPAGGSVVVEVGTAGALAEVSVLDQCGGIPDDELARVFETAYRRDSARTPGTGSGAGLGLAIARGFVQAHRGALEVRNEHDGCRFTVRLPAVPA